MHMGIISIDPMAKVAIQFLRNQNILKGNVFPFSYFHGEVDMIRLIVSYDVQQIYWFSISHGDNSTQKWKTGRDLSIREFIY